MPTARLMLTGGGTAGHVYPALAVAESLLAPAGGLSAADLLYVGSQAGPERDLAGRWGLAFQGLSVQGGIRGMGAAAAANAVSLIRGLAQAMGIIRQWRPSAILATGGYVCAPVVLAGWLNRVPSLVYLPDIEPGWAIRFLAPFARRVAVTSPESVRFFGRAKSVVTGYPVRAEMKTAARPVARAHFGFPPDEPVLLVAGGSRGARHINSAVSEVLPDLLNQTQVIHVCGQADHEGLNRRIADLPAALAARYRLYPYLHEMPLAMAAADLAVSRSGASVLGEYPVAGLPAILIPYAGGHRDQELNAAYLARHGAALVIPDQALTGRALLTAVRDLMEDKQRLAGMRQATRALAEPFAADRLADELKRLARNGD